MAGSNPGHFHLETGYDRAAEIEEGTRLQPKFDADGLITAVATDAATGELLMVAHMNAEALCENHRDRARRITSAVRAKSFGARARSPATPSAWSRCASIAIRMRYG